MHSCYIYIETYLYFEAEVLLLEDVDFLLHRIPVDQPVTQPQIRAIKRNIKIKIATRGKIDTEIKHSLQNKWLGVQFALIDTVCPRACVYVCV